MNNVWICTVEVITHLTRAERREVKFALIVYSHPESGSESGEQTSCWWLKRAPREAFHAHDARGIFISVCRSGCTCARLRFVWSPAGARATFTSHRVIFSKWILRQCVFQWKAFRECVSLLWEIKAPKCWQELSCNLWRAGDSCCPLQHSANNDWLIIKLWDKQHPSDQSWDIVRVA